MQTHSHENDGIVLGESELNHNHVLEKSELNVIKIKAAILFNIIHIVVDI